MNKPNCRRRHLGHKAMEQEAPEIWEPNLTADAFDLEQQMFWDELDWLWDSVVERSEE